MKNKNQSISITNIVFDTPIYIQSKTVKIDENAISRESWQTIYKVFASARNLFGKEFEIARQENAQDTIKFIIKYGVKISEDMRILFNGKILDIEKIDNIGYKNELIEIRAVERFKNEI